MVRNVTPREFEGKFGEAKWHLWSADIGNGKGKVIGGHEQQMNVKSSFKGKLRPPDKFQGNNSLKGRQKLRKTKN